MPNKKTLLYKEFLRKHTTEDIVNKMSEEVNEDAPTVSAGSGAIAGIGVGPDGEPGIDPKKAMKRKKEQEKEQEKITKKISKLVKQNEENNNVILKGINTILEKLEDKIDEVSGVKSEIQFEEEKEYQTFSQKFKVGKDEDI